MIESRSMGCSCSASIRVDTEEMLDLKVSSRAGISAGFFTKDSSI